MHPLDLSYIFSLARELREELGFLPFCAYELARAKNLLKIQRMNDAPCGFILTGPANPGRNVKIYQVAIQYDARLREHATQLVREIEARAATAQCPGVTLRCAADLDANLFWQSLGYVPGEEVPGGTKRHRAIIPYSKLVAPTP
jgi:ribosomal protein S18 acetylase RimI-like enzyme